MSRSSKIWIIIATLIGLGIMFMVANSSHNIIGKDINPSQYHWIDNFDQGETETNMVGGGRFIEATPGSSVTVSYNSNPEEIYDASGYSLQVDYSVPEGEWARLGIDLNGLDSSQAEYIQFWVKGQTGHEQMSVTLADRDNNKVTLTDAECGQITNQWSLMKIPVQKFAGVHTGRLEYLQFHLLGAGQLLLDNIAFYSDEPELFKRSLMDNLGGFPEEVLAPKQHVKDLLAIKNDKEFIRAIARDTWCYFDKVIDVNNHLVLDFVDVAPEKRIGDFTSVTNIGLYFMCVVSAHDLGFISRDKAVESIQKTLEVLGELPRWKGLWYNFYSTTNKQVTRQYISSVDNGWLAAGFIVAKNAYEEVAPLCQKYLDGMNFGALYNKELGQINLGYDVAEGKSSPYHYGIFCTEPRTTSIIAIGKGDVEMDHWFRIHRTLPPEWDWQSQIPQGEYKEAIGVRYLQGYYETNGVKIVPSWGGSMFEFLMPLMVVDEQTVAPKGLGLNNQRAVDMHIDYALNKQGYPVWGMSPCSTPDGHNGGYAEFGVASIGTKGYPNKGVITPHAAFLALMVRPEASIKNIRTMIKKYDVYGQYGLYDALDVHTGQVSQRYMSLDQGMSLVAMNNYVNNGAIQKRFQSDPIFQKVENLLKMEQFFPSESSPVNEG